MNVDRLLSDPGSTTLFFRSLTSDYELEVLFDGIDSDQFKRIVLIRLDKIPVMLGVSITSLNDKLFLDILQNASTTPIGSRLFANGSEIRRSEMQVSSVLVSNIQELELKRYLSQYSPDIFLRLRISVFSYKDERMELKEYVLPELEMVLDKYLKKEDF